MKFGRFYVDIVRVIGYKRWNVKTKNPYMENRLKHQRALAPKKNIEGMTHLNVPDKSPCHPWPIPRISLDRRSRSWCVEARTFSCTPWCWRSAVELPSMRWRPENFRLHNNAIFNNNNILQIIVLVERSVITDDKNLIYRPWKLYSLRRSNTLRNKNADWIGSP